MPSVTHGRRRNPSVRLLTFLWFQERFPRIFALIGVFGFLARNPKYSNENSKAYRQATPRVQIPSAPPPSPGDFPDIRASPRKPRVIRGLGTYRGRICASRDPICAASQAFRAFRLISQFPRYGFSLRSRGPWTAPSNPRGVGCA